jgi:hypothetical protein
MDWSASVGLDWSRRERMQLAAIFAVYEEND